MSGRLVTVRGFAHEKSFEAIEINSTGFLEWVAVEYRPDGSVVHARFPTTFDHLRSMFAETGRSFDPSRLPDGVKEYTGHMEMS